MPYMWRDPEQIAGEFESDNQPYAVFTDNNLGSNREYLRALCRKPTSGEAKVAGEILGSKITDEGVADLLWAVFMLPEFQLVR